jgi:hypothetical protein
VIAFNSTNDLYRPADEKNVRILENEFPGTIISMKFYIDQDYIMKVMEERKNEN